MALLFVCWVMFPSLRVQMDSRLQRWPHPEPTLRKELATKIALPLTGSTNSIKHRYSVYYHVNAKQNLMKEAEIIKCLMLESL